jgi:hypothetical protein
VKALIIKQPGEAQVESISEPPEENGNVLRKVLRIGLRERSQVVPWEKPAGYVPADEALSLIFSIDDAPGLLRDWSESAERFKKIMTSLD